jgi:acetyltransferase-like isoleucine patch superfamily enzyme
LVGNAVIENNVFIGMLVTMANDNSMGRGNDDLKDMLGPTIREGAIIGQASCLLPGVIIGENSIVGANSVVTKDVEEDTLVMGVPAKKVSK